MVGPAVDLVRNPLGAIRGLFAKACESGRGDSLLDLSWSDWGVRDVFHKYLYEEGGISQVHEISVASLESIPTESLVRWRGMVQDMLDVEYYIGAYKDGDTWHTNKYTDKPAPQDSEQLNTAIWDRRLLYCIPVPGENQWFKDISFSSRVSQPEVSLKRQREAIESMDCDQPEQGSDDQIKRVKIGNVIGAGENVPCGLHFEEAKLPSFVIMMYDGSDGDLKLNDVAEFVGVFTSEPVMAAANSSLSLSEPLMEEDIAVQQLCDIKISRLHCITLKKVTSYHIPRQFCTPLNIPMARHSLLSKLQTVFGGDQLAAEYLLLHLISKVHSRVQAVAVGKLSLNFTGCEAGVDGSLSPFATAVARSISMLLPYSHVIRLSLENLNSAPFSPWKDYGTNRLVTGALQLAGGTHLTLDETALNTGRLNETGVKNLQSLKNLLETQKVDYDFQYYQMEMPTDLPVLVLSSGKSRLLPTDALVPLRCTADVVQMHAEESDLIQWRMYLGSVREAEHVIESDMQKALEDDLVVCRQRDRTISPDTFHRWLTMARLLSLSFGERILTLERWEMMKNLETSCAARIRT